MRFNAIQNGGKPLIWGIPPYGGIPPFRVCPYPRAPGLGFNQACARFSKKQSRLGFPSEPDANCSPNDIDEELLEQEPVPARKCELKARVQKKPAGKLLGMKPIPARKCELKAKVEKRYLHPTTQVFDVVIVLHIKC